MFCSFRGVSGDVPVMFHRGADLVIDIDSHSQLGCGAGVRGLLRCFLSPTDLLAEMPYEVFP